MRKIAAVNGAGKIQDTTTDMFGTLFSNIYKLIPLSEWGYTSEQVTVAGADVGSRLGGVIEKSVSRFVSQLTAALNTLVS